MEEEVTGGFAGVPMVTRDLQTLGEPVYFGQQAHPLGQEVVHATVFAEVLLSFHLLNSVTQTKAVAFINVEVDDLLKDLVQGLVRMGNEESVLVRKIVVEVRDDLHCHVSLASSWGADHKGESRINPGLDSLHLGGCEGNRVLLGLVLWVGPAIGRLVSTRLDGVVLNLISKGKLKEGGQS